MASVAAGLVATGPADSQGQPVPVERHAGIYDASRARAVFFGGYDGNNQRNEAWTLTLADTARWAPLSPTGALPAPRFGHSAVYDSVGGRMVVFGGWSGNLRVNETWALSLADPPQWELLAPAGTPPAARAYHGAIFDPPRDRMLVFGGEGTNVVFSSVWALSLGDTVRWEQLLPTGGPPNPRRSTSAIYDPVRDRMIVFGGLPPSNDVWALSLADTVWREITPGGIGPSPRFGHTAIYDPAGDRMIVFGGSDGVQVFDEVWALSLQDPPTWSRVDVPGYGPSGRSNHSAVYDEAHRAMVVFGGLPFSDPTWVLSLGPPPAWSPYRPAIRVSAADLDLTTVTVGDTVSSTFSIANDGLRTLGVSSIEVSSGEFQVDATPPLSLPWTGVSENHLLFAPTEPRAIQDSIVVVSNDPAAPRTRITVGITALGLDFRTRILGEPDQAPLGVSLIAIVTPDSAVRIERGRLYYRIAGAAAAFDSVELTPLATDFIAAVPAEAVTERGVEYFVEVENSGFTAVQPPGAPGDSLFTQAVAPPAVMEAVPRPNSGSDILAGRPVEVDVLLPAGAVFVSGTIDYREGGAGDYVSAPLSPEGIPGVPLGTIPAERVGPRGVEYRVEVRTLGSELHFPSTPTPAVIRTRVQGLTEPSAHPGSRYRLLSVPVDFGVDFAGSLDAILSDQLGTYDPLRWRAFWYDPDSLRNFEFSPARAQAFRPAPGRAFWLITRDGHRVDTRPVDGLSPPTVAPFPIVLAPGWNQVGNPFDFPVAWADVIRDPAAVGEPVAFDPTRGAVGDYADTAPAVLEPFEGYFIENVSSAPETLRVPPLEAGARPARPPEAGREPAGPPRSPASEAWSLRLEARTEHAADVSSVFGVDPRAADALDPLDQRKPPLAPGPWVRLAFAHPSWSVLPGDYRRDVRAAGAEGDTWQVELRSAVPGEQIALVIPGGALPPGLVVRIFDRELDGFADLQAKEPEIDAAADAGPGAAAAAVEPLSRCRVLSFGPDRPYRLAIVAGSEAYVAAVRDRDLVVPLRLALDPAAPNPFRSATRIRFALPRATRVTAEIFDILGARVATLTRDARLEPGRHGLIWDGRDAHGARAPSGVYLLRVVAGAEVRSTRLVLVR